MEIIKKEYVCDICGNKADKDAKQIKLPYGNQGPHDNPSYAVVNIAYVVPYGPSITHLCSGCIVDILRAAISN